MIDRLTDNGLMESVKDEDVAELMVEESGRRRVKDRAQRDAVRKLSARWGEAHKKRVDELTQQLMTVAPDAPADEAMLLGLAATTSAISEVLGRAQLQLVARLERLVDDPKLLLAVARALRETTAVQTASTRSFQELVEAAATMRAQRSLVRAHSRKETWHAQVGGAHFDSARRDLAGRSPSPN